MKKHDASTEKRAAPRFLANEGAMAFVAEEYGKIIDVSMKGLSFQYIKEKKEPSLSQNFINTCFTLDIASGMHNFCMKNVPIKIISEQEIQLNGVCRSILTKRRCSVAFKDLTPEQVSLLKRFVMLNQYGAQN